MTDLGVVVNPKHLMTPDDRGTLRPASVASIVYRLADLDALLAQANGAPLVVSLNNECAEVRGDWSGFADACEAIAGRYKGSDLTVCCGHELDTWWARNPLDCPPVFGASLVAKAAPILRPAGIRVSLAPVAGPQWPAWLGQACDVMREHGVTPDAVAADFYGQIPDGWGGWGFGPLADAIAQARGLAGGLPLHLREYGCKLADARLSPSDDAASLEANQAAFLQLAVSTLARYSAAEVPTANWFCYTDQIGRPDEQGPNAFGLVRAEGTYRPAFAAFATRQAVTPPATPAPTAPTREELEAYAASTAEQHGVDRTIFHDQIEQESHFDPDAHNDASGADGIAQIVVASHPTMAGKTRDPRASLDYAAAYDAQLLRAFGGEPALMLAGYNAGPGNLARGLAGQLDGWPYAETVAYVSAILHITETAARKRLVRSEVAVPPPIEGDLVYTDDVPDAVTLQRNSWSCAVRAVYVMLYELASKGLIPAVTYGDSGPRDVYDWLVPTYDDAGVGLHDHTGAGIVAALAAKGIAAANQYPVSLSDVQARAGRMPVGIGGDAWGHWAAVRGREADGTLILENPAPGYKGINDILRDSFDALGPFGMVWIPEPAPAPWEPAPTPPPTDDRDALLARYRTVLGEVMNDDGSVVKALLDLSARLKQDAADVDNVLDFIVKNRVA